MRTISNDTHPETEKVLTDLIRKASTAKRISMARSLSATAINLARRAIKRANPGLDEKELNLKFISCHYGENLANSLREHMKKRSV